jgi:hypothetical protein
MIIAEVPANVVPVDDVLLQYGAVGVIAILALAAVRVLFKKTDEAYKAANARADRLEAELQKLNDTVQQQYLTVLAQATAAMSEAFDVIKAADGTKRDKRRR